MREIPGIEPGACALADLGPNGDPRVRPSVFWAGGFVSDAFGSANHSIRLGVGPTNRELFANTQPWGLLNLRGNLVPVFDLAERPADRWERQVGPRNVAPNEKRRFRRFLHFSRAEWP